MVFRPTQPGFGTIVGGDPAGMDEAARQCEAEAAALNDVIREIRSATDRIFASWTGTAADTLRGNVREDLNSAAEAQAHLREAAAQLKRAASEVRAYREKLKREALEEEKRKREQNRGKKKP